MLSCQCSHTIPYFLANTLIQFLISLAMPLLCEAHSLTWPDLSIDGQRFLAACFQRCMSAFAFSCFHAELYFYLFRMDIFFMMLICRAPAARPSASELLVHAFVCKT